MDEGSKTLRPTITRVIGFACWAFSTAVTIPMYRFATAKYGGWGLLIAAVGTLPMHFFFWAGLRMRVVIHRDRLTIVRLFSTVEVERSRIRSAEIGPGALWGEMIVLNTVDGIVGVPAFQASGRRSDTWTHEDMAYALDHINYWLEHGEPYLGTEVVRDLG